jgi:peptidoglycan hydrolase CwlO-like protein
MFFDWLFLTIFFLLLMFLLVMMYFYKNVAEKEKKAAGYVRKTLEEAETIIRKYQVQVQRTFGDIDMLNEELAKLRNDVKGMRSRNTQYRSENDKLKVRIKELESKIEALI